MVHQTEGRMRAIAKLLGLLLILGGCGLGFISLNHYYQWVELPFEPTAAWGENLVARKTPAEPHMEDRVSWPQAREKTTTEKSTSIDTEASRPTDPKPTAGPGSMEAANRMARSAAEERAREDIKMLPWGLRHPKAMQVGDREEVRLVIDGRPEADPAQALAGPTETDASQDARDP